MPLESNDVNSVVRSFFYPFLLPNGLLCVGALFVLARSSLPPEISPFLEIYPLAVVVIGLLLGWRFNRIRLVYAIMLLLLVELSLSVYPAGKMWP